MCAFKKKSVLNIHLTCFGFMEGVMFCFIQLFILDLCQNGNGNFVFLFSLISVCIFVVVLNEKEKCCFLVLQYYC